MFLSPAESVFRSTRFTKAGYGLCKIVSVMKKRVLPILLPRVDTVFQLMVFLVYNLS